MKEIVNIEGIEIETEKYDPKDAKAAHKHCADCMRKVREASGMNRKDCAEWLGIPYRSMQGWELARRVMPEYVLRLIAYKVYHEKVKKSED